MLNSHPKRPREVDALVSCVDTCFACAQACEFCADASLSEAKVAGELRRRVHGGGRVPQARALHALRTGLP